MAKQEEKPDQQPTQMIMTPEVLQELLKAMAKMSTDSMKTYVEESKKPTAFEQAKIDKAKEHYRDVERQSIEEKARREANCTHIHENEGKSTFWRFENCYPEHAWTLMCCRCYKVVQNFKEGKLIANPEFDHWWKFPSFVPKIT